MPDKIQHTCGPWELEAGRAFRTASGEFYLSYGEDKHGNALFRDFCELDQNAHLIARATEAPHGCDHDGCGNTASCSP